VKEWVIFFKMAFRLASWGRQVWRVSKAKECDTSYRKFKPEFTLFFDRDLYFDNGMLLLDMKISPTGLSLLLTAATYFFTRYLPPISLRISCRHAPGNAAGAVAGPIQVPYPVGCASLPLGKQ
jgi:hypothetical protein